MAYIPNYPGGWQTGAGGGTPITAATLDQIETQHDKAVLEITREIFAVPFDGTDLTVSGHRINAPADNAAVRLLVPQDFTAETSIEIVFRTIGGGASMHFDFTTYWGAYDGGEQYNVHTENAAARDIGATVAGEYNNHDISDLVNVAPLAAGDVLKLGMVLIETVR